MVMMIMVMIMTHPALPLSSTASLQHCHISSTASLQHCHPPSASTIQHYQLVVSKPRICLFLLEVDSICIREELTSSLIANNSEK